MYVCFYLYGEHRDLHGMPLSFPTRRSSDLHFLPFCQSRGKRRFVRDLKRSTSFITSSVIARLLLEVNALHSMSNVFRMKSLPAPHLQIREDRKSTRLNSSH